jgi:hypothetical protein
VAVPFDFTSWWFCFFPMGGCPVQSTWGEAQDVLPSDVQELIDSFNACLPDCTSLHEELSACRRRVTETGYIRRKLWVYGFGRGHCMPEVDSLGECTKRRAVASTEILRACSTDPKVHGSFLDSYQRCVNGRESDAEVRQRCARVLENFLQCATRISRSLA